MSTSKNSSFGMRNVVKESRNCMPENTEDDGASMKRAAEQRIKSYFQQLTEGCGKSKCENEFCASSGKVVQMQNNDAAVLALQLFKKKAKLCESLLPKARTSITVESHQVKEVPHLTEKSLLEIMDICKQEGSFKHLVHKIGEVFSSPESLCRSFLVDSSSLQCGALTNVDIEAVRRVYSAMFALEDSSVENSLQNSLIALASELEINMRYKNPVDNQIFLNQFVVVMENTMLQSPEYLEQALPGLCKALSLLPLKSQAQLVKIWATFSAEDIRHKVETLQQLITYQVLTGPVASGLPVHDDQVIINAVRCMKLLYCASIIGAKLDTDATDSGSAKATTPNENSEDPLYKELKINPVDCPQPKIDYDEFVNEALNEQIEMDRDFTNYKNEDSRKFSFLTHSFILTTATKSLGLFYDNRVRMYSERRLTLLFSLVRGQQPTPYLRLKVRRDHLIEDALVSLEMVAQDNPADLKKQLYVEFEGEQGIDEGGVSKEFFQLVVEQIFNPDYGMFTYNEKTRMCWFNPTSFETDAQFVLIGLVLGLAIYNNVILDVHFPMVVYRKLFGKKGTFADLKDSHQELAQNLQSMMDYTGDVEKDLLCNFTVGYTDVFGANLTQLLKENGDNIPVTNKNREEYVNLYTDFILNKSVEKQFSAFRRGFDMVVDESPLKTFFRPDEVELLVCGSKDFDFDALEKATEYDGGLTKDSQLIKWFWELVHSFTMDQKRQLLMFTTGSDRIPVGGLAKLKLIIAKNGPDSDRLPTAHTCFNVLLLPEYSRKDKLEERLLKAITHAKGFGML